LPLFPYTTAFRSPISPDLDAVLNDLSGDQRVRILRLPENLGIIGGMRVCLEAATGRYIIPLDADDLLTADALQILGSVIERLGEPCILYSDEDILIEGVPTSPYWRPDWDPVLNLASSYIWHLCAIRRDVALKAGLYSDASTNWCHDWDTIFRILDLGHEPVHVPEILYHWRQHAVSSTNTWAPDKAVLDSPRLLLESRISRQPRPELYKVALFPIFRGADEWYVLRQHIAPIDIDVIVLATGDEAGAATADALRETNYPFGRIHITILDPAASIANIISTLRQIDTPHVLICSSGIRPVGEYWAWEAIKLFEMHREVCLASGRLFDRRDIIVAGGASYDDAGQLINPDLGRKITDSGHMALALKPQCVAAVPTDFFFAERNFLKSGLNLLPDNTVVGELGVWLGALALEQSRRVAMSPLIQARVVDQPIDRPEAVFHPDRQDCFLRRFEAVLPLGAMSSTRFTSMAQQYR
jgi:hypothetical protein